jgi:hypothetical protein
MFYFYLLISDDLQSLPFFWDSWEQLKLPEKVVQLGGM